MYQRKERYEGLIREHIVPSLGNIELAKVTPSDIQGLEARLLAHGMSPKGVESVHWMSSRVPSNTLFGWR